MSNQPGTSPINEVPSIPSIPSPTSLTGSTPVTLDDILARIEELQDEVMTKLVDLTDAVDAVTENQTELASKVDEINLPTGLGMGVEFES